MKVGIVVPFSWSYIGGVSEHAEAQAEALERIGFETRLIMGDDPPGTFWRLLHPDAGRLDRRPSRVMSIGTTVTVPANNSRTHIVLSQIAEIRLARLLRREKFDLLHIHEPMTPALCVAALAHARSPVVGTWHATGELGWMKAGMPMWGMLMKRIDYRIAVSEVARASAARYLPGAFEIIPNGITLPPHADPGDRENIVVFIGRHDPRKGLEVLLRAWPEVQAADGRDAARDRRRPAGRAAPDVASAPVRPGRRATRRHGRRPADRRARPGEAPRARPRSAASRSAWCSRGPSGARRRWSPPTFPATTR